MQSISIFTVMCFYSLLFTIVSQLVGPVLFCQAVRISERVLSWPIPLARHREFRV